MYCRRLSVSSALSFLSLSLSCISLTFYSFTHSPCILLHFIFFYTFSLFLDIFSMLFLSHLVLIHYHTYATFKFASS